MKFGPVPISKAAGKILGHNISNAGGKRALRKGKCLTEGDIRLLAEIGCEMVYVAELQPGDIREDAAAARIARSVCGEGILVTKPDVGRANLLAEEWGVLRVDAYQLACINGYEGITVATLPTQTVIQPRKMVATIKVIPYSLPETVVRQVEIFAAESSPILQLYPLRTRRVALILSSSPFAKERVTRNFVPALQERVEGLGSRLLSVDFVPLEDEAGEIALAETIQKKAAAGAEIIILAGETAIMDRHDLAPRAVERAGGEVTCYGAPVDPGNLLMLGYLKKVPILGAPGCARSQKTNVIDWVLPPLLAGERLSRNDIIQLGCGGLLEEIPGRPTPRE